MVVSDLDAGSARETVAAIRAAEGTAVELVGDVAAPVFPGRAIATLPDPFGGVDILQLLAP